MQNATNSSQFRYTYCFACTKQVLMVQLVLTVMFVSACKLIYVTYMICCHLFMWLWLPFFCISLGCKLIGTISIVVSFQILFECLRLLFGTLHLNAISSLIVSGTEQ